MTFECIPLYPVELYWTYETTNSFDNVTVDTISQSKFLKGSSLLHQLILPIATVNDTGNYTCFVQGQYSDSIFQVITLTVLPGE